MSAKPLWALPRTWTWASIGEIATIVGGGTPSASNPSHFHESDGTPWITPADLTGYKSAYIAGGRRFLSAAGLADSSAKVLPKGTVLLSSRAPIGYCAIAANPIATNQGFKSLVLHSGLSPEYCRYYLLASKSYLESLASGTTFLEISGGKLAEASLPVAPPAEQKRIVAKVDSLFAKSARAREELARVEKLVPRFKQVILKEILSLRSPSDETYVSLSDIAEMSFDGPFGSNLKSEDYTDVGKYVVRLENIGHLYYKMGKDTFVSEEKFNALSRHKLLENDVLFSSFIEEQVRVCLLPTELGGKAINKADVFCVRSDPNLCLPKFLMYSLGQPGCFEQLKELVHGATRPRINLRQLKSYKFHLPALNAQQDIVSRIDSAFAKIDLIAAEARRALQLIERLDEAILGKAFRGELASQDPNDEPASTLLERIAAERAKEAKKPNSSRVRSKGTIVGSHSGPVRVEVIRSSDRRKGPEMTKSRKDDDVMGKPYLAHRLKNLQPDTVQALFGGADLPVSDFYKQLAWEIENGFIIDDSEQLRAV